VRGWTHLERQRGGGIGLRGPGETQLETDRRLLAERVKQLQRRLGKVEAQRDQARRARLRAGVPVVALVGYTNAGKSTLFNALTGAAAYAADQLFATLDPTLRRLEGLSCGPVLLADTVGFVRDLPHDLVAAFRATLAEARDADLLLHVIDAADPEREQRIADVESVLVQIGAGDLPQLRVYNKIDRVGNAGPRLEGADAGLPRVAVSALKGLGLDLLKRAIEAQLGAERIRAVVHLPSAAGRLRARLHEQGVVAGEVADDSGWSIRIDAPRTRVEPLFGLSGGDGDWLRAALLARADAATYNPVTTAA
jgi:GTP-binding protein HflX